MDNLYEFLKGFSLQTIITIVAVNGYFYHKTDQKIEKIEMDLKQQGARTDHLYEMFLLQQKETKDMFIDLLKNKS